MTEPKRDWNLAILGALIALIALVIGRALWSDADKRLEEAKVDYVECLTTAQEALWPEQAEAECKQEWKKAQDAYWIP